MADLWPGTLPQVFEDEGFSETLVDNAERTDPDAGAVLTRRRYTAVPKIVTGTMTVDSTQRDTLESFARTHTAARFQWEDPRGNTRYYLFARPPSFHSQTPNYVARLMLIEFQTETGAG